jgi:uncharacterized protein with ParB-like and HNH nuclease domain
LTGELIYTFYPLCDKPHTIFNKFCVLYIEGVKYRAFSNISTYNGVVIMSGFQSPITIYQAIERINKNEFLLPAFQREFVWKAEQIEKLFDSLMQGYPISSMLFWKVKGNTKADFKFYKFLSKFVETHETHNDVTATNGVNDFHAILDGQQRLTALYLGLCGSYAYKTPYRSRERSERNYPTRHLYFNISSVNTKEESDRKYKFSFLDKAQTNTEELYVDENEEKWFKVGRILELHKNKDFDLDDFSEKYSLLKDSKKLLKLLDNVIHTDLHINYYEEDEQDPDKAVNIFVRINSGGTALTFSDILMSIAVASWKNEDARTEINNLVDSIRAKDFNIDKDYILRAFLYLYHKDVRFRITSFSNTFTSKIESNWNNIRDAILSLFDLIKVFGLNNYSLTTNNATLPILYYIYHRNIFTGFATKEDHSKDRETIKKWLLTILVRQVFGGQTDTVLTQSRKTFTNRREKEFIDSKMKSFPASGINTNIKKITDIDDNFINELLLTQKGSRYSLPILALLYPDLDYKNNNFHQDHLHPKSLYNEDYDWRVYNSILNLQMLDRNENESKSDMSLKDWVKKETKGKDLVFKEQFMERCIIPQNIDLGLSNFDEFIAKRKKLLVSKLKKELL